MDEQNLLQQTTTTLLTKLNANPTNGLTQEEATKRLKKYGSNEVPEKKPGWVIKFLKKFWGVSAWMLELIILLSLILGRRNDAYIVSTLLGINALVSFLQEWLASNALETLKKRLQIAAKVLRNGQWSKIEAKNLVPGDIISIMMGDFVPADIKIISGSLEVDQSLLTGESLTIEKTSDEPVYSGSIIRRGEAKGLVVLTGIQTYFGKTIQLVQIAAPASHIELVISKIATWLFTIVTITITILFFYSIIQGIAPLELLPLMLVLLLGGIPVSLPAMFTVSMALGAQTLSKKNVLVTRLSAVEDAATMTVLCADKTGTITMNHLAVTAVYNLAPFTEDEVLLYAALASQAESLDQIDLAFLAEAQQKNLASSSYTIKKFIPFDPASKRSGALIEKQENSFYIYKGALEPMIQSFTPTDQQKQELAAKASEFAHKGFRTIAVAKIDRSTGALVGLVALEDPPRPHSKQILANLAHLGLKVKMLTGDSLPIAQEMARKIGLQGAPLSYTDYKSIAGKDPHKAQEMLINSAIFAGIYPEDKYAIVKTLQQLGAIVGMTGDGINDAPALQQAEVGIAVSDATDVAKKAASVVLTKQGLSGIKELITIGRLVFQRVQTWVINKISRTILKTGFIVIAYITTGRYVITASEMILLIFMTDFMKLSLATDNERIAQKPCQWKIARLVNIASILGIAMLIEAYTFLYVSMKVLTIGDPILPTFSFAILFYFAVFSLFVVREEGHFWASLPSKTLLGVMLSDMLFAFLMVTFGLLSFKPIPIPYTVLIICYALIFSLVINDQLKCMLKKKGLV